MSAASKYDIGDVVRIKGSWTLATDGSATDPTVVEIEVRQPDGSILQGNPQQDSVGTWHADFPVTQEGWHDYKVVGRGNAAAVEPGGFLVRPQVIAG